MKLKDCLLGALLPGTIQKENLESHGCIKALCMPLAKEKYFHNTWMISTFFSNYEAGLQFNFLVNRM